MPLHSHQEDHPPLSFPVSAPRGGGGSGSPTYFVMIAATRRRLPTPRAICAPSPQSTSGPSWCRDQSPTRVGRSLGRDVPRRGVGGRGALPRSRTSLRPRPRLRRTTRSRSHGDHTRCSPSAGRRNGSRLYMMGPRRAESTSWRRWCSARPRWSTGSGWVTRGHEGGHELRHAPSASQMVMQRGLGHLGKTPSFPRPSCRKTTPNRSHRMTTWLLATVLLQHVLEHARVRNDRPLVRSLERRARTLAWKADLPGVIRAYPVGAAMLDIRGAMLRWAFYSWSTLRNDLGL